MPSKDLKKYEFVRKDYRWQTKIICPICKKERWVWKQSIQCSKNFTGRCKKCNSRVTMRENARNKININRLMKDKEIKVKLKRDAKGQLGTWVTCPNCQRIRWVTESNIYKSNNWTHLCASCNGRSGAENGNWKGGLIQTGNGYMQRLLKKGDKYYDMVKKTGYVLEHRYVVAKKLGRSLKKYEVVHHLNGIKDDNRDENLEIVGGKNSTTKHRVMTLQQKRIRELEELLNIKEKNNG